MRDSDRTVRVVAIAERQSGVIGWAQLRRCGLTKDSIGRWVRQGRLHRIHPRVYAVGHRRLDLRGRLIAALFFAGPGAALSHHTAAFWLNLLPAQPQTIHVTSARDRRSLTDVRVHRCRDLVAVRHNGLPVTTVERTLLDLAAILPVSRLNRALAETDYRGLLDRRAVERALGRGRQGAAALRTALSAYCPELAQTRSVLEEGFLTLCQRASLPPPEVNATVEGLMVDAVWRDHRLIVELDGVAAHSSPAQVARDRERELRLRQAGYAVVRYSWRQVRDASAAIAAELRAAL